MKPTTIVSALLALVSVMLLSVEESEAQCMKWSSGVSICETNPSTCVSGAPDPTFGQWRYYYSKLLSDDAQTACEHHYAYTTFKSCAVQAIPWRRDPTNWAGCYLDQNCDGDLLDGTEATIAHSWVERDEIAREAMCELTPNGPYANLGTMGVDGGSFTTSMRNNIKNQNIAQLTALRSDIGPARPPTLVADETDVLSAIVAIVWNWDNYLIIPYIWAPNAPNVDHIIPRKDIYGCDCGPNSYANAQVISWRLNNRMSNNSQDPDRAAILERYTLP
jgi:hypothetical protein